MFRHVDLGSWIPLRCIQATGLDAQTCFDCNLIGPRQAEGQAGLCTVTEMKS